MKLSLGAQRLRRWRTAAGLTQMAAAGQVEIDLYHYSKIERGVKSPGRTLSVRFRNQAGIDPGDWDLFSERSVGARARG